MWDSIAPRARQLRRFVDDLFSPHAGLIDAVVADGWPRKMAAQGIAFHRHTWDVDALVDACERELRERDVSDERWQAARSAMHLWPALPGAGLTPVLYAHLLGVERQWIRVSSRGRHVGDCVLEAARRSLGADVWMPAPAGTSGLWAQGEVFVVSGSDETCRWVREHLPTDRRLVAYHHRVSVAVVVDGGVCLTEAARALAVDTVMWHQRGCFSPRGVLFCGSRDRMNLFAAALGRSISVQEREWEAREVTTEELAARVQRRALAEFQGPIYGDGLGWVEVVDSPFRGEWISSHAMSVHALDGIEDLASVVDVPHPHVQGVGLAAEGVDRPRWEMALCALGATRVCRLGELQAPPASWPHDGQSNVEPWLFSRS